MIFDRHGREITTGAEVVVSRDQPGQCDECGVIDVVRADDIGSYVTVYLPSEPGGPSEIFYALPEGKPPALRIHALSVVASTQLPTESPSSGEGS